MFTTHFSNEHHPLKLFSMSVNTHHGAKDVQRVHDCWRNNL